MSDGAGLADLVKEVKETRDTLQQQEAARQAVIDELKKDLATHSKTSGDTQAKLQRVCDDVAASVAKCQALEETINDICKKMQRPNGDQFTEDANRKAAVGLLRLKHELKITKKDFDHPFTPSEDQITEAQVAVEALRAVINSTDQSNLPIEFRKALTSFSFGSNGFILAPEMSSRILSCLVDQTDVAGIMANMTIAGPSVKFLIDNVELDNAAWACETQCFANNPQAHLTEGLGELEIKPETLRYVICATRDILEDASINIESWMINKVNRAFRNTISKALISGSGVGMPVGILNPAAGIPICDTSDNSPAGQFTWQDLVMLRWQVPGQWQGGGRYLMNQHTFGLTLSMSDANGRPIMLSSPLDPGQFLTAGQPIQIVTQMPDVAPGATPVAYGNWNSTYMVVNRKAVTMQQDPYSAGFCVLFKFDARVGGAVICPQAARLLRIQ
jgi:HK97 family phage major capsid protein